MFTLVFYLVSLINLVPQSIVTSPLRSSSFALHDFSRAFSRFYVFPPLSYIFSRYRVVVFPPFFPAACALHNRIYLSIITLFTTSLNGNVITFSHEKIPAIQAIFFSIASFIAFTFSSGPIQTCPGFSQPTRARTHPVQRFSHPSWRTVGADFSGSLNQHSVRTRCYS